MGQELVWNVPSQHHGYFAGHEKSRKKSIEIFCSYAYEDEHLFRKLEARLSMLKRQGLISTWHDRQITAGTGWAQAVDTHLETASLFLLLVSADFFVSDYCYHIEMQQALERHKRGAARV